MNSLSSTIKASLSFAAALAFVAALPRAQAQTFNVVYNFTGESDGGGPLNGFIADGSGNLYGTTNSGGTSGYGVVFKMSTSGVETILHNFTGGSDGANPVGILIRDKSGNLYGTTTNGGASGAGSVFKITATGTESVLYSFTGKTDGSDPEAGLAIDSSGNLYGTTTAGGANGGGAVFKLTLAKTRKWMEKVLYSFGTGTDGTVPVGGVTLGSAGTLLGTTSAGGTTGYGTIFELASSGGVWKETIVHEFADGDDGAVPYGGLIASKSGILYGAATEGGNGGGGTIYELTPVTGGGWNFNVIYSNPGWGISGEFRDLMLDASGNIYGTTHCDGDYDAGTVYELTAGSWTYNQLYQFTGGADGLYVFSNLALVKGKFYGTTNQGGANGFGVVFQVTP